MKREKDKRIVSFFKNIFKNERAAKYFKNIGEIETELFINKARINHYFLIGRTRLNDHRNRNDED